MSVLFWQWRVVLDVWTVIIVAHRHLKPSLSAQCQEFLKWTWHSVNLKRDNLIDTMEFQEALTSSHKKVFSLSELSLMPSSISWVELYWREKCTRWSMWARAEHSDVYNDPPCTAISELNLDVDSLINGVDTYHSFCSARSMLGAYLESINDEIQLDFWPLWCG